ncbi:unnamed protein product, partial [Phaeothamnion confervicola]
AVALSSIASVAVAQESRVVSPQAMQNVVGVEILRVDGTVIQGRVTNKTAHRVQRPELVATYSWLWHDDYHPGADDPGWVAYAVLPDDLGPYESANFTIDPERPLPDRDDGKFMTSVAVSRVTEFKLPGAN